MFHVEHSGFMPNNLVYCRIPAAYDSANSIHHVYIKLKEISRSAMLCECSISLAPPLQSPPPKRIFQTGEGVLTGTGEYPSTGFTDEEFPKNR